MSSKWKLCRYKSRAPTLDSFQLPHRKKWKQFSFSNLSRNQYHYWFVSFTNNIDVTYHTFKSPCNLQKIFFFNYRIDQNIRCGGTKTCSHQPHRSNQSINLVIWGIILEFRTIQFTWPMRLVDFNLGPEKMAPKVKKSEKNQGPIFMFFFTLRAIFSGLRSKSENCIGHVNCVVLSYRMIPQKTKFAYRSRL